MMMKPPHNSQLMMMKPPHNGQLMMMKPPSIALLNDELSPSQ
jgi:hypothetical protein